MNTRSPFVSALLALLASCGSAHDPSSLEASLRDGAADVTLASLAQRAVDPDEATASAAIAALRAAGPEGLALLLDAHAAAVTRLRTEPMTADLEQLEAMRGDAELRRLRDAIDHVAAQRDAFASGFYWYTDLDAARAEAARTGRPILSLRLLGRLDEEASCANSRFFRWLLYPSPAVRQAMSGYVLHWSSERPAPHITIDMGDGRTIERTITGNSIHYVLDTEGHVIDAIAGLHTTTDFAQRLDRARAIADRCGVRSADRSCVATEHRRLLAETQSAWMALGDRVPTWEALVAMDGPAAATPSAFDAMPITIGKASIEMPMLRLMDPHATAMPSSPIDWDVVAQISPDASFGEAITVESRSLARLKTGDDDMTQTLASTFVRTREDSERNRFTLDRRLHAWLATPEVSNDFDALNQRVYAELFLTPASDPWLGLRERNDWDVLEVTPER